MKTTMNISIEQSLKNAFSQFARDIGTNPTNLINMLMTNTINQNSISFNLPKKIDLEIENFTQTEIDNFGEDFINKTKSLTNEMKNVLSNRRKNASINN